mmetsp:Transcript_33731/g.51017  ORF Transcript_33731/g.51017 Transcript_33731/m.51017 type:complete len:201 (+) Transcript_33731:190-792(+)
MAVRVGGKLEPFRDRCLCRSNERNHRLATVQVLGIDLHERLVCPPILQQIHVAVDIVHSVPHEGHGMKTDNFATLCFACVSILFSDMEVLDDLELGHQSWSILLEVPQHIISLTLKIHWMEEHVCETLDELRIGIQDVFQKPSTASTLVLEDVIFQSLPSLVLAKECCKIQHALELASRTPNSISLDQHGGMHIADARIL